jgi:hypothetical protein
MTVITPDIDSFRPKLGPFYARWRERAGPAAWRLFETYSDEFGS